MYATMLSNSTEVSLLHMIRIALQILRPVLSFDSLKFHWNLTCGEHPIDYTTSVLILLRKAMQEKGFPGNHTINLHI